MIVGFSTSSPRASVCVFERDGGDSWMDADDAPRAAGGACLRMLREALDYFGKPLTAVELFLADLGPGSFTGTRVGVTLAKTLAYAVGAKVGGADAFDLVNAKGMVILPSRKGEWFVRAPGEEVYTSRDFPAAPFDGFCSELPRAEWTFPSASQFQYLLDAIEVMEPELLLPKYLLDPSISTPKRPYGVNVAH